MANDTKERILAAALEMFSQYGYAGTNIRELSASLGLVKSGVYKHYESKEAIWNALLDQMIAYYGEHFGSAERLPPVPDSTEELVQMTMQMVNFTVRDERIIMTRKVLTLEQYRDARARELATKHFLTGLIDMFTHVFAGMMDKGLLRRDDPAMLAFARSRHSAAISSKRTARIYGEDMKFKGSLIVVKDCRKALKFYQDMFGFALIRDHDGNMELSGNLYLQEEKYWERFTGRRVIPQSNQTELYFEEPEIDGFAEKLERLYPDTEYVNHLMTHSWGQRVVRFYDPDGNLIEVGTPV